MANILAVGIATIDIINTTDGYPQEDEEVRALEQQIRRGGNATNTLVALSQLGNQCYWLGSLADDSNSEIVTADLDKHEVDHSLCHNFPNSKTPTSYIALNRHNGSRTIIHYRSLPELPASALEAAELANLDWIHFEGRNVENTQKMLAHIKSNVPTIPVSLEVEKKRDQLEILFTGADIYFFSKAFADSQKIDSAQQLLHQYRTLIPDALLVCTWGSEGAYALHGQKLLSYAAQKIPQLIDTIGAGDTFNAGFIQAKLADNNIDACLKFACDLATKKCGIEGFSGLV